MGEEPGDRELSKKVLYYDVGYYYGKKGKGGKKVGKKGCYGGGCGKAGYVGNGKAGYVGKGKAGYVGYYYGKRRGLEEGFEADEAIFDMDELDIEEEPVDRDLSKEMDELELE